MTNCFIRFGDKFCSQCGKTQAESEESCDARKKDLAMDVLKSQCPYKFRHWYTINDWASIVSKIGISVFYGKLRECERFSLYYAIPQKKNGRWPDWSRDDRYDWPHILVAPHPGHPGVFAERHGYGEQFYLSREVARKIIKRIQGKKGNKRYLSYVEVNRIIKRCDAKYGYCNGRYHAEANNTVFGEYSSGDFSPVTLGKSGPAFTIKCCVCGDLVTGAAFYSMDYEIADYNNDEEPPVQKHSAERIRLMEDWEYLFDNFDMDDVVCEKPMCLEVFRFTNKDQSLVAKAKDINIPLMVPKYDTIRSYPKEFRGAFLSAKLLDFEARYLSKKNKAAKFRSS